MEGSDITVGEMARIIIQNHKEDKCTLKKNLKYDFRITNMDYYVEKLQQYFSDFKIELVGLEKERVVNLFKAEKYFLIAAASHSLKKLKISTENMTNSYNSKLIILFTIIFLEKGKIDHKNLVECMVESDKYGNEKECDIYLNFLKSKGYLQAEKDENSIHYSFSWRYHAEFMDFEPFKIFKSIYK